MLSPCRPSPDRREPASISRPEVEGELGTGTFEMTRLAIDGGGRPAACGCRSGWPVRRRWASRAPPSSTACRPECLVLLFRPRVPSWMRSRRLMGSASCTGRATNIAETLLAPRTRRGRAPRDARPHERDVGQLVASVEITAERPVQMPSTTSLTVVPVAFLRRFTSRGWRLRTRPAAARSALS